MFFKKNTSPIDWIIAGLGNPGKKYEGTLHNVGFAALDVAAKDFGVTVKRSRFDALCGDGRLDGQRLLLLKPQTFMNLSGKSLVKACEFYHVPAQRVIVLCDDVALAPGVLRIRLSGSDGGHNGLKSVITFLGQDFARLRIGVGAKPRPEYELADWVLSRLAGEDKKRVEARYPDTAQALRLLLTGQAGEAMARYNGVGRK